MNFTQNELFYLRNGVSLKIDSHLRASRSNLEPELIAFHQKKVDEGNALILRLNEFPGVSK